jgi:hypothetical protein
MIKVHFEITAWEWYTLQTACNDWQNANSESLWVTSTLSAMWVEKVQVLKHKKFWVNINEFVLKCSATIVIALGHDLLDFQSLLWSFSTNMRFVLYSFSRMAPCFYVTLETYSNVLIIFDWSKFLYGSLYSHEVLELWPFVAEFTT